MSEVSNQPNHCSSYKMPKLPTREYTRSIWHVSKRQLMAIHVQSQAWDCSETCLEVPEAFVSSHTLNGRCISKFQVLEPRKWCWMSE